MIDPKDKFVTLEDLGAASVEIKDVLEGKLKLYIDGKVLEFKKGTTAERDATEHSFADGWIRTDGEGAPTAELYDGANWKPLGGGGNFTQKRLLYNTAGETTIKDEEGNILTHADIYAMLMTSPDFVVLVRSDHAFHPNLVTPTQIAFTCSYLGTDNKISTERVNITSDNAVTYTSGKGVMYSENGGVGIGGTATGSVSFAQGWNVKASAYGAHAEGESTDASGVSSHAEGLASSSRAEASHAEGNHGISIGISSHAEGTFCTTKAGTSHAEGNYCETGTNGGSAHAEGSYTTANGAASHTEGYRTTTTEGGQHAQGCWNKVEGGQFAFMHGCGTDADNLCNAFIIAGDQVYMRGIGGYDGTNYGAEGVKSVQTVIRELQLKLVNF